MTAVFGDPSVLYDRKVVDGSGNKIGKVSDVYVDDTTGEPEWVAVATGWFGGNVTFVPITAVSVDGDDGPARVSFDARLVEDAPHFDSDGALSEADEQVLYDYYRRQGHVTGRTDGETEVGDSAVGAAMRGMAMSAGTASDHEPERRPRLRRWAMDEPSPVVAEPDTGRAS